MNRVNTNSGNMARGKLAARELICGGGVGWPALVVYKIYAVTEEFEIFMCARAREKCLEQTPIRGWRIAFLVPANGIFISLSRVNRGPHSIRYLQPYR